MKWLSLIENGLAIRIRSESLSRLSKKMNMFRYLIALICPLLASLSSCSDQYNIMGNSSVENYDGNTLYLKVLTAGNGEQRKDSSEVIHGRFGFEGVIDTVCMAQIYLGGTCLMPIVLETGQISINFSDAGQTIKGGTLNERLYKFLGENARLQSEVQSANLTIARQIMDGCSIGASDKLERHSEVLQQQIDRLWTSFIIDNKDNVLGPTYFMQYTSQYFYPVITPQIEKILKHAPKSFLCHPDVQAYIRDAEFNMRLMQGDFR